MCAYYVLQGFWKSEAYIATQYPLAETTDDFWRMVWQENCRSLVMLLSKVEMEEVLYLNRTFNGLVIPFILLHCVSFLFNVESSNVVFFFIQLLHFLSLLILANFWINTSFFFKKKKKRTKGG